jgi:class 3 adenylate cyclase/tetratricopeptide (TPR) repeat protein
MLACPQCGRGNAEEARFCSNCGARLDARARPGRRTVTAIFTDVTGFTGMSEHLDPERMASVMSRYFGAMRAIVERHGGTVEKFIGDAVMAVFGFPEAHEDDALRAVRAAAEMRDAIYALNDDLAREWGVTIQVRTGVNTGEVAVGAASSGPGLVVGDAVNVAARLEQAAAPTEILLGERTYRLVEGTVEAEAVEPLRLKGKDLPVHAFRLFRVLRARPARTGRLTSPFVGRSREREALLDAFRSAVAERGCRLVTVLGTAGVGKSRLAVEFVKSVGQEATVLQGECLPYGDAITYWPVARVVGQAAGIDDDDPPDRSRVKIAALLEGDDRDGVVEALAPLFGPGHPTVASDEVARAVRKLLEVVARRRPVVLVFEDTHWADPAFLDLVEHMVDWSRDAPIMLLCLARPELLTVRPGWGEGNPKASSLRLDPLSDDESVALIENLLGRQPLAARARGRLSEVAEGNPLYLEELLSMLIDEGVLRREGDRWVPVTDLHEITVPPTLQSLLATRLDRLPADDRQVIEVAAVMGTVFDPEALLAVISEQAGAQARATLEALVDNEFVRAETSSFGGDALRFHHVLLRDAAYQGMPKETRAQLHERFAGWLERTAGERIAEYEEILGHHLESAYRYRADLKPLDDHDHDLARRAGERLAAAGAAAFARGDALAAANLLSRSAELLPSDHEVRLSVLPDLSEALMMTGLLDRAKEVLDEGFAAATASGDRRLQAHVMLVRSMQRVFTEPEGGAEAGRREVGEAIPLFEQAGDQLGLARSWQLLSLVHLTWARFAEAEEAMSRAAEHAALAGNRRLELEALSWLPLFVCIGPTPPREGVRRNLDVLLRAKGDLQVEANVLLSRAVFEAMEGRFTEGRQLALASRAILEDLGLRVWLAGPWAQFRAWVELLAGDFAAAERELRFGAEALESMGESGWLSTVAALLARSLCKQGRYEEAERFVVLSENAAGGDDVYSHVVLRCARAIVRARTGDLEEGERLARQAVMLSEPADFLLLRGEALMDLAVVLDERGRSDEAAAAVVAALRLYEEKGSVVSAERARARLGQLNSMIP